MEMGAKQNSIEYEIELVNVCKKYGEKEILNNLNISFPKDKITVITGPSGVGKTTLLNIISGLDTEYEGNIFWHENVSNKKFSYIFQEDRLIPWLTVYENIEFVLKSQLNKEQIKKVIDKNLKLVKLYNNRNMLPETLSGGMKRRVAIARAFAYESNLLLMDEPFKGLDNDLKKEIIEEFLTIWNNNRRTVILITHDKGEAEALGHYIYKMEE